MLTWEIVDYLEGLPSFIETDDFILVHSGLPIDEQNCVLSPKGVSAERLVYDRLFNEPYVLPKTDKCILFGHTPTVYICDEPKILKYKRPEALNNGIKDYIKIHLDVGTWINGTMGCICIDTLNEYYVSK